MNQQFKSQRSYRIALLAGGSSSEREVSLLSAANAATALRDAGHQVTQLDTTNAGFIAALQNMKPDAVFIALHGHDGEDGSVQGLLEMMQIPYTGSKVLGSALAMDKEKSKLFYQNAGLNVPASIVVSRNEFDVQDDSASRVRDDFIVPQTGLPVVVKPVNEGSSVGISIVFEASALRLALLKAFVNSERVLVEQYVKGTEVTVSVLGNDDVEALPVVEIVPQAEFYDYHAKYADGGSEHYCPARIPDEVTMLCQKHALLAHRALGLRGVSRSDFIIDEDGTPWIIESNTIPGMTVNSLLPIAAREAGFTLSELYSHLIDLAIEAFAKTHSGAPVRANDSAALGVCGDGESVQANGGGHDAHS